MKKLSVFVLLIFASLSILAFDEVKPEKKRSQQDLGKSVRKKKSSLKKPGYNRIEINKNIENKCRISSVDCPDEIHIDVTYDLTGEVTRNYCDPTEETWVDEIWFTDYYYMYGTIYDAECSVVHDGFISEWTVEYYFTAGECIDP